MRIGFYETGKMRIGCITYFVLFAFAANLSLSAVNADTPLAPCAHDAHTFRCVEYLKNYDADTITFRIPGVHPLLGEKISVRVAHIDASEIRGHLPCERDAARTARRLVESLLRSARRIDLTDVARDKYFRILADVEIDGRSLKDLLLKNRLAYGYEGGTKEKRSWCQRLPAGG